VLDEGAVVGGCPRRGMRWQDGAAQEVEKLFAALVRFRGLVPSVGVGCSRRRPRRVGVRWQEVANGGRRLASGR
jgi:hypothetical protein